MLMNTKMLPEERKGKQTMEKDQTETTDAIAELARWLQEHGCDGLCCDECFCSLEKLM